MNPDSIAGIDPGQRQLNGPQTTGRTYRNLSQPTHAIRTTFNEGVTTRDGTQLMADVYRPESGGKFPALLAVSCYPRQIQNSGAPLGFVEAGASDFWVPRGYAHVIANTRSTGDSGGQYSWLDETERHDMADLVEWVASQPWCNGRVGMIGISYFAMTQLAAAIEAPTALQAIFPIATTADAYDAVWHHGLLSTTFVSAWLAGVATLAQRGDAFYRNEAAKLLSEALRTPRIHQRFAHFNGEAAISVLGKVMLAKFARQPWGELLDLVTTDHQLRDEWWQQRNMHDLLRGGQIPTYLGCDWENVPLHLPSTFTLWDVLSATAPVRIGMLGAQGLTWPWESLHVEALAWFDHWLKDIETGIMDGPPIRYWLPGAEEFRTAETWPPPDSRYVSFALRCDATLDTEEGPVGARSYIHLPKSLNSPKGAPRPGSTMLSWQTSVLDSAVDVVGDIELQLDALITATDTSWIVTLQDVSPEGRTYDVTAGWLRASLREVDPAQSRPGAPVLACTSAKAITPSEVVSYRIPMVPNARRFLAGHRIRLVVASDDTTAGHPSIMKFQHQSVGQQSRNTVSSSSRLLLPILPTS